MIQIGIVIAVKGASIDSLDNNRITEDSNNRITEDNNKRIDEN